MKKFNNIEYKIIKHRFYGMKNRCYNKNYDKYKNYGGRGIIICDEWLKNIESFVDWSKKNGFKKNLTIDRIDNNGNCEPSNCRWATHTQQQNNKRKIKPTLIEYAGQLKSLNEWCDILNIKMETVRHRLKLGISLENALEYPTGQVPRTLAKKN